jgi:hypothetical protein
MSRKTPRGVGERGSGGKEDLADKYLDKLESEKLLFSGCQKNAGKTLKRI